MDKKLYKLLRDNERLKELRHPMFEKNRFMKYLGWFMVAYYAAIAILLGVTLSIGLQGSRTAAFHILDSGFYFILIIDFWSRFVMQETPAQKAQHYALLPIRRSFLMHTYLFRSIISTGNLFWGFFLIPFGVMSVTPLLGWWAMLGWLLGYWIMIVVNSLCYLFTRALCMKNLLWFLAPLFLHAALICICFIPDTNMLCIPFLHFVYGFAQWSPLPFLTVILLGIFWYWANFRLQSKMVYNEVSKKENVTLKHATQLSFLNRYGALGEYLKLEIKLRMRNKQVRTSFIVGVSMMLIFSLLQYFTDVYDNSFMTSFICLYCYIALGMMTLTSITSFEGNYMDGLMARRESILSLLRAKYYFNSVIVIIPFLILLPLMIIGKQSVWMNLCYMFLCVGFIYPIIFQFAAYNKETIPLNQKITGRQGSATQQIVALVTLFAPIGLVKICILTFGDPFGYLALIGIGLMGIATHRIWLKSIYLQFMQRRYINMEGFRASRNS